MPERIYIYKYLVLGCYYKAKGMLLSTHLNSDLLNV